MHLTISHTVHNFQLTVWKYISNKHQLQHVNICRFTEREHMCMHVYTVLQLHRSSSSSPYI